MTDTFKDILDFFPTDELLTAELLEAIGNVENLGTSQATTVAKLTKIELARLLKAGLDEKFARVLLPAASKIIDLLVEYGGNYATPGDYISGASILTEKLADANFFPDPSFMAFSTHGNLFCFDN